MTDLCWNHGGDDGSDDDGDDGDGGGENNDERSRLQKAQLSITIQALLLRIGWAGISPNTLLTA